MSGEDIVFLDIAALAGAIARKELSPVEVARAYLDRIERLDGTLHAYISVRPEAALKAARAAEAKVMAGEALGPLHGVPLAVKDLFDVGGWRRTCGSAFLDEEVAADATAVARLRSAGAVLLGLLNLHEFAFGPTGINPHHGTARNPWDTERVSGGSSSGSGCAVAAGLAAGALGTDTGGSIRIPAALCGVVGLKQSYGLASRSGIYPLSESFDHGGPLARTVADAALLLQAIAGEDPTDPSTRGAMVEDYTAGLGKSIAGLRVGVPEDFFFTNLDPEIDAAVRAAIAALAELGAHVEEVALPFAKEAVAAWVTIALVEAHAIHEAHLDERGDELSPDVRERLLLGRPIAATEYERARTRREALAGEMARVMERLDVLALPATPISAVPVDNPVAMLGGREVRAADVLGRFTRLAAFTGQPALSLPCGFTAGGLPIGLQLIGRRFEDAALLRAAHAYEQATPWHARRPPEPAGGA
jgi:aspartyl-tRNA(Asn)/glutamyl-tRNA(Gln) amidotransferase subunit A